MSLCTFQDSPTSIPLAPGSRSDAAGPGLDRDLCQHTSSGDYSGSVLFTEPALVDLAAAHRWWWSAGWRACIYPPSPILLTRSLTYGCLLESLLYFCSSDVCFLGVLAHFIGDFVVEWFHPTWQLTRQFPPSVRARNSCWCLPAGTCFWICPFPPSNLLDSDEWRKSGPHRHNFYWYSETSHEDPHWWAEWTRQYLWESRTQQRCWRTRPLSRGPRTQYARPDSVE